MGSNLLCTLPDHIHIIVVSLQHCLCLLLNLQGTLMCFLRSENSGVQWSTLVHFLQDLKGSHFHCVNGTSIHMHKHPSTENCLILVTPCLHYVNTKEKSCRDLSSNEQWLEVCKQKPPSNIKLYMTHIIMNFRLIFFPFMVKKKMDRLYLFLAWLLWLSS